MRICCLSFKSQRRQRFVEQQYFRLHRQSAGNGHALALAARQRAHQFIALAGKGDEIEQFIGPFTAFVFADAAHFQSEGDVFRHRHQWKQGEILENQRRRPFVGADTEHVLAADSDLALGGIEESGYGPQNGSFAAARWPQEAEEFAFFNRQMGVLDRGEITEANGDMIELDIRTHIGPSNMLRLVPSLVAVA